MMKRLMIVMSLCFTMLLHAQTEPTDGDGDGKREVSTKDHLLWICNNSSAWGYDYEQTADITFEDADFESGGDFYNGGSGFSPIGNSSTEFTGEYDGGGYTIDNLYINRPSTEYIALFGKTDGATITNIGVTNVNITGNDDVGGLVGSNNSSTVSNSYSAGSVSGGVQATPDIYVTAVTPNAAIPGETITLYGIGFTANPGDHQVLFGDIAVTPTAAGNQQLDVTVPTVPLDECGLRSLAVVLGSDTARWIPGFTIIPGSGSGGIGSQQVISTAANGATSVYAADLDGDGDLDVLSASAGDDKIAWYANDGAGTFGSQQVISTAANGATSVYTADLDGDGDLDVLSASDDDDKIAWYANDGTGTFGSQQVISTAARYAKSVYAADLDGDGDPDVLSASAGDDKIAWYANDGAGTFGSQQVISTAANGARDVHAADLDGDGDLDVISASSRDDKIAWYANNGTATYFNIIAVTPKAAIPGETITLYGIGFTANPGDHQVLFGDHAVTPTAAGNQQLDVTVPAVPEEEFGLSSLAVAMGSDTARWMPGFTLIPPGFGSGVFGSQQVISTAANGALSMHTADLDGDGDQDVLSASFDDDKIAWYANDGAGTFGSQQVITTANGASDVYATDLDGDGDQDVLSASFYDEKIAWYANDGTGTFGNQQVITHNAYMPREVHAADLDGDGDTDVLWAGSDEIAWYANNGAGTFGSQQVIANGAASVYIADLDGDGDPDVLSASSGKIAWYANDGTGSFGPQQDITTAVDNAWDVYAADLDGDGDLDVLSASHNDDKIAWYANDGTGTFGSQQVITTAAIGANDVYAADLDGDGDLDVLSGSENLYDHKIAWYTNDGAGMFGSQQVITTAAKGFQDVHATDLDGDGDLDVLSASHNDDKIAWYRNETPNIVGPPATPTNLTATGFDKRIDLMWTANLAPDLTHYTLYRNTTNDSTSAPAFATIAAPETTYTDSSVTNEITYYYWITAIDSNGYESGMSGGVQATPNKSITAVTPMAAIPGETITLYGVGFTANPGDHQVLFGDHAVTPTAAGNHQLDVTVPKVPEDEFGFMSLSVVIGSTTARWTPGFTIIPPGFGSGMFGSQQVITAAANGAEEVHTADLDGDGDLDVLSASRNDNKIAWYANDGTGTFGSQQVISTAARYATSVYAADLDGDGDPDVLSASAGDDKIAWYANDGAGSFGPQQVITTAANGAISVYATDLDGDGDRDVLSASAQDNKIAWYANDGTGTFGSQQVITTAADGARDVYAADLDGDGDQDVLSASYDDDTIAWYVNDGTGMFGSQQVISTAADGARDVYTADLDGDGDQDVLSASGVDSTIAWYANNGAGTFGSQQVITTATYWPREVHAADLDGDGDLDVLSASSSDNTIAWYVNDGTGTFGSQQVLSTTARGARDVYTADLDGDGDQDVLSAAYNVDKITWYRNETSTTVGPPSTPTNLTAIGLNGQVDLAWTANTAPDLAQYTLYRHTANDSTSATALATITAPETTYTDTHVTNETIYYYWLTATDSNGNESAQSTGVQATPADTQPPASPSALTAEGLHQRVDLTWAPNSEPDLAYYLLYRNTTDDSTMGQQRQSAMKPTSFLAPSTTKEVQGQRSAGPPRQSTVSSDRNDLPNSANERSVTSATVLDTIMAPNTTYTDTAVVNDTTYYYWLTAVDSSDNESGMSAGVQATPQDTQPPATPTDLTATGLNGQVDLAWTANTDPDLAQYTLYRHTDNDTSTATAVATIPAPETSYIDSSVTNETTYYYWLTAVDSSGNESTKSAGVQATPADTQPPATPAGLTATGLNQRVDLTWMANSEPDLGHYTIYRHTTADSTSAATLATIAAPETTYTDTSVTNDMTCFYWLTATDSSGNESGKSAGTQATPQDTQPPAIPTNLTAEGLNQRVDLTWAPNSEPDLAYYLLYRNTTDDSTMGQQRQPSQLLVPSTTGKITGQRGAGPPRQSTAGATEHSTTSATILDTIMAPDTTYTDNAVVNDTTYYYWLTAVDSSDNESTKSAGVQATPADTQPPATPTGLTASSLNGQVDLAWTANTEPDLAHYTLYRNTANDSTNATALATIAAPNTTYTDTSVTNGTTYYYWLTATDSSGNESGMSAGVQATPEDTQPPASPISFTAEGLHQRVDLAWAPNSEPDLAYYLLYRNTTDDSTTGQQGQSAMQPSRLLTPFTTGEITGQHGAVPPRQSMDGSKGRSLSTVASDRNDVPNSANERSITNTTVLDTINAPDSTYTDTAVVNDTTYYYWLTAVDSSGNESAKSASVQATPADTQPPATPTNLTANALNRQVDLAWAANIEPDLARYTLYRDMTDDATSAAVLATIAAPDTTYTDTSVTNDTTYFYWITATDQNDNESGMSAVVQATPTNYFTVTAVTPWAAIPGETITIYGLNFTVNPEDHQVLFGDNAVTPVTASNHLLHVTVPAVPEDEFGFMSLAVTLESDTARWTPGFTIIPPGVGSGVFGSQQVITTAADGTQDVHAADLDGDGDLDVLSASFTNIAWYANDGTGHFGSQQVITMTDSGRSVQAADLDEDGDLDVLTASSGDDKIAWYANDGAGNFGNQQVISTAAYYARSVHTADLNGDGHLDVLSASAEDDKIAWYANDGMGHFGSQQVISAAADGALDVYTADLNGDGAPDVLSASQNDNKIAWYANDGAGNFGSQQVISTAADGAQDVQTADLDGDGDLDVLSASFEDDKIAWYANDGTGNFGSQQVISTAADGVRSVYTTDLDGDGDQDVLSASIYDDEIAWYTNDGEGNFGSQQVISTTANGAGSVFTADLDGDGDQDVLSDLYNKIAWYRNETPSDTTTAIGPTPIIPKEYALFHNYPNPFNPVTTLKYALPKDTKVHLSVYDLTGRKVATLVQDQQQAGWHHVQWHGTNDLGQSVSTGVYFYRIVAGDFVNVKKMVYMK